MKKALLLFLLSVLVGTLTFAQQPGTPAKTTTPVSKTLTPAEQRQKEKIDREIQRERQIRAEWAQKQRDYEAKQAEKERQKQAKKAEKERQQQDKESDKPKPAESAPTPVSPSTPARTTEPVTPAPAAVPAVTEPTRKEKREQRKKEEAERKEEERKKTPPPVKEVPKEVRPVEQTPVPAAPTPVPVTSEPVPVAPTPVEAPKKVAKPQRPKREKKPVIQPIDSAATISDVSEPSVVRPRREFLPKGHLFEPILLDPLEAQTYGSVLPMYYTEGERYKGSIVPFAFGFAKAFYRRTPEPGRSTEWVLDLASFTQFEAYRDDKLNKARRQIMNNDYKVSIIYNVRRGANNYRFRVYHISSHLGDDYIYRNKITAPMPNSVNYEQLDATYSRNVNNWRLYGGAGIVLRKSEERKLLSAQLGAFYKKASDKAARLVGGVDIKFWQQTDFRPGIHAGIGVEVGRTQNNLTFLLEGYSGFRPYSQYESQQTKWLGIGLYLNPF